MVFLGLLYLWLVHHSSASVVTRAILQFFWVAKMEWLRRVMMNKSADNGGKGVPNITFILMTVFVCGCIKL